MGVVTAADFDTKAKVSPFDVSQAVEAALFSEAEVRQLFGQFEEQQRMRYPGFALPAAIATHAHAITKGAPDAEVRAA